MNELIIIGVLILLNGALALSEIALVSAKKALLNNDAKKGDRAAARVLELTEEPERFLSAVQIGITVIGILTGLFSGGMLADDLAEVMVAWGVPQGTAYGVSQALIVVLVTYLTLIFGELVPKRVGMSAAEKTAKLVSAPMYWLARLTAPFVWLLSKSTSLVVKIMGVKAESGKVTEEEIKSMISEGAREGEVQEVEQDIVERVFMLGDLRVGSLMTHRSEVVAIDVNMNGREVRELLKENMYEKYPVIDRNFDNVKGVVSLKSIFFALENDDFDVVSRMEEPVYFHENMSVYKALEQMKERRISQALICDEFGDCLGLITLKDIMDGLVGTVESAHDEPDIVKRTDGEGWLVDGQCPMYDFLLRFDAEHLYSSDNDFHTLGGLVLEILERIPECGESVEWNGFRFEVLDMDGVRIDKILVTVIDEEEPLGM